MTSLQELPLPLPQELSSPSAISSSAEHSNSTNNAKNAEISGKKLSDDFLHFYQEGKLSDATLSTEGKPFPVHRSILAARSSVFHAMFEKDEMSEGRSGLVDIDDVDSETVDRMLVFLYGAKLGNVNWEEASALYYAADKYDVQSLKEKCANILKTGLSLDNVCNALVMADRHLDEELMKCTVDFIGSHQEVFSSTEWDKLEENNLRLAANVMRKILVKRINNNNLKTFLQLIYARKSEGSSPSAISSRAKRLDGIRNAEDVAVYCGKLSDDFLRFYQEGKLSDATLSTEGKTFSVHRSILAARSSVFHAMFQKDEMSEGRSGVVDINDVGSETMDRMLIFLYSDSLEDMQWEEASALYYAADKYDVQPLKEKCAHILKASLTVNSACDTLILADKHLDEHLMKCAVDFIKDHQEIFSSSDWKELEKDNPYLVIEVFRKVLAKQETNLTYTKQNGPDDNI